MLKYGTVKELYLSTKEGNKENPKEIVVDEKGIYNDKYYAKNLNRSILISSNDSYILAKENGIDVPFGSLGENIFIDINPYNLTTGKKIYIGEVILEITQNCTICNSLAKVDEKLPEILKSDRGIFAKVINSGKIRKGDTVKF